jgi:protein-disulfide isomerase
MADSSCDSRCGLSAAALRHGTDAETAASGEGEGRGQGQENPRDARSACAASREAASLAAHPQPRPRRRERRDRDRGRPRRREPAERADGNDVGNVQQVSGGAEAAALLEGIPQSGTVLGEDTAPVTLVEYADLQCPYCAHWSSQTFPALVADYVRDGRLRIEFRGLAFIGPDSEDALRAAHAAGGQGKLWHVIGLLYANQGAENAGWVTDDLLRDVGAAVPGLDADRMLDERGSASIGASIDETAVGAHAAGISGTPSFLLGPTGGKLSPLEVTSLEPDEFRTAIDKLLQG